MSAAAKPAKTDAPAADLQPAPGLAPAAESQDPAVHQLIAEAYTAHQNGDEAAEQAARAELAKLGFQ